MDDIELGLESRANAARREEANANMERVRRMEVFKSYRLSREDIDRTSELSAGDPVGDYKGYPEIQAQMIADEKAPRSSFIEKIARGIGKFIGIPMDKQ